MIPTTGSATASRKRTVTLHHRQFAAAPHHGRLAVLADRLDAHDLRAPVAAPHPRGERRRHASRPRRAPAPRRACDRPPASRPDRRGRPVGPRAATRSRRPAAGAGPLRATPAAWSRRRGGAGRARSRRARAPAGRGWRRCWSISSTGAGARFSGSSGPSSLHVAGRLRPRPRPASPARPPAATAGFCPRRSRR